MMLSLLLLLPINLIRLFKPGIWLAVVDILDVMSCRVDLWEARSARVAYAWLYIGSIVKVKYEQSKKKRFSQVSRGTNSKVPSIIWCELSILPLSASNELVSLECSIRYLLCSNTCQYDKVCSGLEKNLNIHSISTLTLPSRSLLSKACFTLVWERR